jgi:hemoglobin
VRRQALLVLAVAALALACARPPWNYATLYDDLGGEAGIASIVDRLLVRMAADPEVAPYFAKTNMDRFERLLKEHLCALADGPCQYTGDSMSDTHRGLGITDAAFTALAEDLEMAMDDVRVPFHVQNRLLAKLVPFHDEIVE